MLNNSPSAKYEPQIEDTIFSHAVTEEQSFKRDISEFEQFLSDAAPMGLQNDSLAELEATLSLAAESSQMRFEGCSSSEFAELFSSPSATTDSSAIVSSMNSSQRSPSLFESLLMENNSSSADLQPLQNMIAPSSNRPQVAISTNASPSQVLIAQLFISRLLLIC